MPARRRIFRHKPHRAGLPAGSALLCLALTSPAFAHADLTSTVPAENVTVATPPSIIKLKFSEALDLAFTGASVTGPNEIEVATGKASLARNDGATLVVPLSGTLAAGAYRVQWHALAKDGHVTRGTYMFTVKP